jgi:hypothetical protein
LEVFFPIQEFSFFSKIDGKFSDRDARLIVKVEELSCPGDCEPTEDKIDVEMGGQIFLEENDGILVAAESEVCTNSEGETMVKKKRRVDPIIGNGLLRIIAGDTRKTGLQEVMDIFTPENDEISREDIKLTCLCEDIFAGVRPEGGAWPEMDEVWQAQAQLDLKLTTIQRWIYERNVVTAMEDIGQDYGRE